MSIKDLPHVTVEQVLALRAAAIELEQELATLKASLPKIRADAASNYLEYLEYCKRISIDNPTEPLEYLAGLSKLEAGE